jgi:hypothetical protein
MSLKRRNNKKRQKENSVKAKKFSQNDHSVPSQSQSEPKDDPSHTEDAKGMGQSGGSQSPSNTTVHLLPVKEPEPVEETKPDDRDLMNVQPEADMRCDDEVRDQEESAGSWPPPNTTAQISGADRENRA